MPAEADRGSGSPSRPGFPGRDRWRRGVRARRGSPPPDAGPPPLLGQSRSAGRAPGAAPPLSSPDELAQNSGLLQFSSALCVELASGASEVDPIRETNGLARGPRASRRRSASLTREARRPRAFRETARWPACHYLSPPSSSPSSRSWPGARCNNGEPRPPTATAERSSPPIALLLLLARHERHLQRRRGRARRCRRPVCRLHRGHGRQLGGRWWMGRGHAGGSSRPPRGGGGAPGRGVDRASTRRGGAAATGRTLDWFVSPACSSRL